MDKDRYIKGLRGEEAAEAYLTDQGMTCIARRYRAQDGEIDLIMDDCGMLVFVEVKSRPNNRAGSGLLAVTPSKQRRMTHAALQFIADGEGFGKPVRFDVVEITADGIRHVRNAFQCSGW